MPDFEMRGMLYGNLGVCPKGFRIRTLAGAKMFIDRCLRPSTSAVIITSPVKEYLLEKTECGKMVVSEKKLGAGDPAVLAVYDPNVGEGSMKDIVGKVYSLRKYVNGTLLG